ncbi:hypothetical protein P4B35_07370 [Pontiellaceae bacterium B12227]|nr:hypothetical protein [Pontiellaceae bacterium B12227]
MSNRYVAAVLLFSIISIGTAQPLSGKLVQTDTGESSETVELTNGALFKVGSTSFRLVIDSSGEADLLERLNRKGAPVRMVDLPAHEAFTMLTHLSGATIVCGRTVEKDLKVSINSQEDSIMSVIEQICFQIDAEATVRKGTVWITPISK